MPRQARSIPARRVPARPARRAAPLLACAIALVSGAASAQESRLELFVNHAKVIKLAEPAATVIIGNNEVADATVKDAVTLVLTGRRFGTTNLVILDQDGEPIVDERLVVRKDEGETVRVINPAEGGGTAINEFSCSPVCVLSDEGAALPGPQ